MSDKALDIQIEIDRQTPDIGIGISHPQRDIVIEVSPGGDHHETWDGAYEVESQVGREQTLETKSKLMLNDLVVREVYVNKVSNPAGGYTYYIGREV